MSSLAAEYRKAKAGLVSLALARRSSEIVMGQLLKSKPAGMNVKEAKPIPHFIGNLSVPTEAPQPVASTAAGASTVPTTMHSDGNSDSNIEIDDQSALITVLAASSKPILAASSKTALAASSKTSESFGSIEEASTADSSMTSLVTETVVRAGEKTGAHTMSAVAGPSNDSMQGHAPRFIRRAGGKGTELSLPSAFPLSMLQSTAFSISGQTEDVLRDYYKHRHLRYEYTGSGGLTMNNNEFPENFLLVNRAHKRELEKKRQVEEKRQRKSEKSKRRHTELTRKLQDRKSDANSVREEEEEEGEVDGGNASARFEQEQYGQEGSDSRSQDQGQPGKDHTMEEVIGEAQDQHMLEATDGEESQSADAGERGDPHHQGHVVRSMMGEEHADGSAILAGVDPQAIEGAESLLGLLKQGL
ncbi:hypothetical protein EC991_001472 [Linnemannia zychae]|nr:hypothetical protein EC991_001472 [Linnemannia zychae]